MPDARVKFSGREFELGDRLVTAGRSSDNDISFVADSNVSRYHVEIEPRGSEYWLIDLNSSNGTTVNGEKLSGERLLADGDKILLGGSAEIEFATGKASDADVGGTSGAAAGSDAPRRKSGRKKPKKPSRVTPRLKAALRQKLRQRRAGRRICCS